MEWIKQIGYFILVMFLQVLLINNLQILGICHPYIYIICLLMMPITLPRWADMLIGAVIGLIMDVWFNSLGVHMASCIMLMFLRDYLIGFLVSDKERLTDIIDIKSLGVAAFAKYTTTLVLIHHTMVFFLTVWSVEHFWFTLLEIIVSSLASILIIMGVDLVKNR